MRGRPILTPADQPPKRRGRAPKIYTKEQCVLAMEKTKSMKAAARFLGCDYGLAKKYFKLYRDEKTGKSLFELHKNPSGKGIRKYLGGPNSKTYFNVLDIVEGRLEAKHFNPKVIKERLIEEGLVKEACNRCGYCQRRLLDYKMPLLSHWKDGVKTNYGMGNFELLCYNCYFLYCGEVLTPPDLLALESTTPTHYNTDQIKFELDDYHLQRLNELGLMGPNKPGIDGEEFISRI